MPHMPNTPSPVLAQTQPIAIQEDSNYVDQCESWEDFVTVGMLAREHKDKSQWVLGRCALRVQSKWGEGNLEKYAKQIGMDYTTLRGYRWVVEAYLADNPNFIPSPKLSFRLYQTVATMPKEKREQFLQEADEGEYSVERARVEKRKAEGKPIHPKFKLTYCPQHDKWWFIPDNREQWERSHDLVEAEVVT